LEECQIIKQIKNRNENEKETIRSIILNINESYKFNIEEFILCLYKNDISINKFKNMSKKEQIEILELFNKTGFTLFYGFWSGFKKINIRSD